MVRFFPGPTQYIIQIPLPRDRFREETDFDKVVKVPGERALVRKQRRMTVGRLVRRICLMRTHNHTQQQQQRQL